MIGILNKQTKKEEEGRREGGREGNDNNKTTGILLFRKAYLKYNKHIMQQDIPLNKNHYLQNVVVVEHT